METKDHYKIAVYCWNQECLKTNWFQKAAFVLGNVEPDINIFTYFRGRELKGHHYEYSGPVIQKIIRRLENQKLMNLADYFWLGVLMHYVADAFTLPHNQKFKGNMKDHVLYEHKLHKRSMEAMRTGMVPYIKEMIPGNLYERIQSLHRRYEDEKNIWHQDIKYIFHSLYMVMVLVKKNTVSIKEDIVQDFSRIRLDNG